LDTPHFLQTFTVINSEGDAGFATIIGGHRAVFVPCILGSDVPFYILIPDSEINT
jgi:hypothetical protein